MLLGLAGSQLVYAAPPVADFTISDATPDVGQSVTFTSTSSDPDDDIQTYEWDFDFTGTFTVDATGQTASTTYAIADSYSVALRVTDGPGDPAAGGDGIADQDTRVRTVNVSVPVPTNQNPTANFTVSPNPPNADQPATFTSTSTDPDGDTLTFEWSFGDGGTASGSPASHTYATSGDRTVTLTVRDGRGGSDSETRTVSVQGAAPTAEFIFTPTTPAVNEPVRFSSTSSDPDGDPLTYAWNFGDGTTGTGPNPTKSYSSAGTRNVTLTVTDPSGDSDPVTHPITVQPSVPNGSFTTSPAAPLPGQAVTFSSTSTPSAGKTITNVEWDFDYDRTGNTFTVDATGGSVSHAFPTAGSKNVAMRVYEEPNGGFDVVTGTVTVNAPPQAAFLVAPTRAFVGDTVTLSSTSSDPDGPLARQDWDLDNDGQFDDANAGVVSTRFRRAGTYTLRLRVTDSQGATAVATQQIRVRRRQLAVLPNVVVRLEGNVLGVYTTVTRLAVNAPRRARVTVRCVGKRVGRGCPARAIKRVKHRRTLRFRKFERRFRPSMKIVVTATRKGYIGKHTTFVIRRGVGPLRRSQCITPGAKRPKKCPGA